MTPLVVRVVDGTRVWGGDGETEATEWSMSTRRMKTMDHVGRDVHKVPLTDDTMFTVDDHVAMTIKDVVKLVCWVRVGLDSTPTWHLELVDEL
jgi:tRNA pseudouridine-54 N-methylase